MLKEIFRDPCHYKVVRITDDVQFRPSPCVFRRAHACINCRFKSIQRHVRNDRRNDSPLWGTDRRREQGSIIDMSRLKPPPQNLLIHRYVL